MSSHLPRIEPPARDEYPVVELPSARRVPPVLDSAASYGPEPVDLREAFNVVRRHLGLIALSAAALTAAALAWVLMAVPEYQARALVRLKDDRGALTSGLAEAQPMASLLMGRTTDPLLSEVEVLKSPAVAKRVVDAEGLRVRPLERGFPASLLANVRVDSAALTDTFSVHFTDGGFEVTTDRGPARAPYGGHVEAAPGVQVGFAAVPGKLTDARFAVVPREEAASEFLRQLQARPRDQTNVVDVYYADPDPLVARRVLVRAVYTFQEMNAGFSQDQARRRREFVERQLASTDSLLAESQRALSSFRENGRVYSARERIVAEQATLTGLDVRRREMEAQRQALETALSQLQSARGGGDPALRNLVFAPGMSDNPVVKGLLAQLISAQTQRDSMTLGPVAVPVTNPDVQRLDALITATRGNLTTAVRNQLEALRAQLASTDQMRSASGSQMERLPVEEAQEVRLNLQFETVRNISDRLREEYQKARMAEVVEAGQVEVLDLGDAPDRPIPSHRALKVLLGLMAGLLVGTGGAFLIEHVNTTVRSREELEALLDLPGLAVIPRIVEGAGRTSRLRSLLGRGEQAGASVDAAGAAHLSDSVGGEAFRTLRTNLMFSQATGALRSLVVTSSAPGEGKSTTASNLAISFAQQGLRVVLVDGDLRRARLHRVFDVGREPGLTQWVLGMCALDAALRPTSTEGLTLLPSGALPPNPAELLGGERMARALRELEDRFDIIVVDTPPLLAASDAAVLAARADGVLLVVRAGSTDRSAVVQVAQQLDAVDSRIIGTVLNDLDGKLPRYGGYYSYDYAAR